AWRRAIPVKLVVIETKLTDELRMFRTAALDARADIQDHYAVMPIGEISQTIFDVEIVQVAAGDLFTLFGADGADDRILSLPAGDLFRIFHVGEIDHSH